jgi:hypothetical protein
MPDGPKPDRVRELLREREDREDPKPDDRDEERAREMRERVEPPAADDD